MKPRLLDLFAGAGGAARGYQRAGFHVTGVDIVPQPNYAGDDFIQADAMTFPLDGFDAIHASPPCQKFTSMKSMHNAREHLDLLTPTRPRLEAASVPYVIENVQGAPMVDPIRLCGSSFGLGVEVYDGWRQLRRHRLFESSHALFSRPCQHRPGTIGIYGDHARDRRRKADGSAKGIDFPDSDKLALAREAMGMPWAQRWKELSEAVPPAFTQFIGHQLMAHVMRAAA